MHQKKGSQQLTTTAKGKEGILLKKKKVYPTRYVVLVHSIADAKKEPGLVSSQHTVQCGIVWASAWLAPINTKMPM